jgi:hypothetical protein
MLAKENSVEEELWVISLSLGNFLKPEKFRIIPKDLLGQSHGKGEISVQMRHIRPDEEIVFGYRGREGCPRYTRYCTVT